MNCTKIVTDKCQNQLFEPIVWSLGHSQTGQFSLTASGIVVQKGLKQHKIMWKQRFHHLKVLFIHSFHAVLVVHRLHTKMLLQYI